MWRITEREKLMVEIKKKTIWLNMEYNVYIDVKCRFYDVCVSKRKTINCLLIYSEKEAVCLD